MFNTGAVTPQQALFALFAGPDVQVYVVASTFNVFRLPRGLLRKQIRKRLTELDKYLIVTRAGPALGLIGTLVPMGTALAGLGQGDFSVMTSELVLAYTTTVVGLLVGSLAFVFYTVRRRYAENDIREMEYLTEKRYHEIHAHQS